jgi:hypothetical protein
MQAQVPVLCPRYGSFPFCITINKQVRFHRMNTRRIKKVICVTEKFYRYQTGLQITDLAIIPADCERVWCGARDNKLSYYYRTQNKNINHSKSRVVTVCTIRVFSGCVTATRHSSFKSCARAPIAYLTGITAMSVDSTRIASRHPSAILERRINSLP